MSDILFNQADLGDVLRNQEQKMFAEVDGLPENRVLNTSVEDLCKYFADKYTIEPIKLNEAGIQVDYGDAKIDVSRRFEYAVFDRTGPVHITGTQVTFYIPFEGDADLFKYRPSTFNFNPPWGSVSNSQLMMTYAKTPSEVERVGAEFKTDIANLKGYLEATTKDVTVFNSSVLPNARRRIEARREKFLKDRGLAASLGFPLKQREGAPQTYVAPQVRRKIVPTLPPSEAGSFKPEPALDMENYEHILNVISNMVDVIERSPQSFKGMKEEDLRNHFLVQLNSQYEGQATGETFNFSGKTDILIRVESKNIFIAECKFWEGPEAFKKAIDQLLGYTTWRDTKIALLVFNRNRDLTAVLTKIHEALKAYTRLKRELDYKSETGFRAVLGHPDDMSRELILTVMVFEVPA